MKLFFRKYGKGPPLVILHGLFGQSDNWNTLAKQYGEAGFEAYAVDLRNHGLSPHSEEWNYRVMAEDVVDVLAENDLDHACLLGHSMGGKVAMKMAMDHPGLVEKLIVADMAPRKYKPGHDAVIRVLKAVKIETVVSRKEAEEKLKAGIPDEPVVQFLLKNVSRKEDGSFGWRFNLGVISKKYKAVLEEIEGEPFLKPVLFIRGGSSAHVSDRDFADAQKLFPHSRLVTVTGAGHWVHAEKPAEFFDLTLSFLKG